ncbi:MAG: hypothetical protein QNL88_05070 [Acidobacteriota bacterium]|nr:hypothetical protein [Acidobacteriota bacterium]
MDANRCCDPSWGIGYIPGMSQTDHRLHISPPVRPLDKESAELLRSALSACPDVAFAHLVDVQVEGVQEQPSLSLFVWLVPAGVRSLRGSLNLVSETVAGAIPKDRYVDVLILNSAPELLADVERAGRLFVERDAGERRRALEAVAQPHGEA